MNRIICILVSSLLLVACSNQAGVNSSSASGVDQKAALQQAQKLMDKAVATGNRHEIDYYKLQAVDQLVSADLVDQAQQRLHEELAYRLDAENTAYRNLLLARVYLAKQDLAQARQYLKEVWTVNRLPQDLQIEFYLTRAEIQRRSGNILDAVQDCIYLTKLLPSDQQRNNLNAIWDMLNQLSPRTLNNIQQQAKLAELRGWLAFASINKQYDTSPEELLAALKTWRKEYPNHPAITFVSQPVLQQVASGQELNKFAPSDFDSFYQQSDVRRPHKIALMLPLQGQHAKSAQAIRDGFLAAYYAQKDAADKPKIQIYDTTEYKNMQALYQQAVDDGADFIVGPLLKEEVEAVSRGVSTSVPVLALNNSNSVQARNNIFKFGLSPEIEARAVALKAWQDGHRNALVVVPKSAWGERMRAAFDETWLELGGKIIGTATVESQATVNREIKQVLGVNASEDRAAALKGLGLKVGFEPRRRQDIDMVFIATNPALARQVKPLLSFYYAGKVATYGSSSIFSGKVQPQLDQDLNGIIFCDMPWILDNTSAADATYKAALNLWPQEFEQYARLYALGLDSYKVAIQIEQLTMLPELGVSGMTGTLTLDKQKNIQRRLTWATFVRGAPQITAQR